MKEIEYWINVNKETLQQLREEYNKEKIGKPYDDKDLIKLRERIETYRHYIMGLQDAIKYIKKELDEIKI